ncbi:DinB family protein [Ktedonospora formicarum]|uniref:Damage-inducible protein DinB n=1 Tax=Ktedonospora formicarum TaxID=2778364 RepID=A0A8J3I6X6_9CHLR|nr:DinB family protein [Ktedonospora formicarum]GHO46564.1 hypothetical protein KSX_47270 [Ktedonospora formicarum]
MAEDNFTVSTFYSSWKEYQDRIKGAIAPLTSEQLGLRTAPNLRSIREIAMHVVSCRAYWFAAFMGEPRGIELKMYADWDDDALMKQGANAPTATEIAHGLDHTWQFMADCMARWSSDEMQQTFPDEYDGKQVELSRAWVVWHVMEHDLHHGGELSHTLGTHGIPADFPG